MMMESWGTWEDLLLGGAVLRHGTGDWTVVASELRARLVCPAHAFTSEVCKSKYEDLQRRYAGCTAWFDELRKKRMAELKQSLEKSEDSIGSLESELESLKADKGDDGNVGYGSSQTESPAPFQKSDGTENSGKEMSKDGLSAGSFTEGTRTYWSAECQTPATTSAEDIEMKPETSRPPEAKVSGIEKLSDTLYGGCGGNLRKRRGKRKSKFCSRDVKEGSIGETGFLAPGDTSTTLHCKENSTSSHGEVAGSSGSDDCNRDLSKNGMNVLMDIYNSLLENKSASVFRRRLDSQKRGRYKKMIRRHLDFDTIRSRIVSHSITSVLELFRDLLLLSNNSLVFYSKSTREYKSALLLRDLITKKLRQHFKHSSCEASSVNLLVKTQMPNHPAKPRSVRPGTAKVSERAAYAVGKTLDGSKPGAGIADSPSSVESTPVTNKAAFSRLRKAGRGGSNQGSDSPMKGRKRIRTKLICN